MGDPSITKGRYSKREILDVIHGVGELLDARRKKVFIESEINKCRLQLPFLEQQLAVTDKKLAALEEDIQAEEKKSLDYRNVYLNLRAANKTAKMEFERLAALEKKSQELIKVKFRRQLEDLGREITELETVAIPGTNRQIAEAESRVAVDTEKREKKIAALARIYHDYRHTADREQVAIEKQRQQTDNLKEVLGGLVAELGRKKAEQERLAGEIVSHDALLAKETQVRNDVESWIHPLRRLEKKLEDVTDREAYFAELAKEVEEMKLGLVAKQDIIKVISDVKGEVDQINYSLTSGIDEFENLFAEFEESIPSAGGDQG